MSIILRILKQPFSYFIVIGALSFFLYPLVISDNASDTKIEISAADVKMLVKRWKNRSNTPPSEEELKDLIEQQIHEEILYREAKALKLDQGDIVIRRRLAARMAGILNDILIPEETTDIVLQEFMFKNPDKFVTQDQFSFSHYYFDPSLLNTDEFQHKIGKAQQAILNNTDVDADPFSGKSHFTNVPSHQIEHFWGVTIPGKLKSLTLNKWSEPIKSEHGMHLFKVTQRSNGSLINLSEIRSYVLQEWRVHQQVLSNERIYRKLRDKYDISITLPKAN